MNRTILTVAGVLSASSLLLVDSVVKGTVLLALAAVVALILRRDSAATRHLVWLLAIVAMLVVPVLSAMLPQWRVLPAWMSSPRPAVADVSPPSIVLPAGGVIESPRMAEPVEVERPIATVDQRVSSLPDPQPALATPEAVPARAVWSWNWINVLPLVWAIGFAVLMLRLSAARWMLWNSERLATVIGRRVAPQLAFESQSDSATAQDPIVTAMTAICSQLGIGRPVTLLIHPHKTIPVVWGILRCRLMLPPAARQWSDEQLQSVLLHELAHIKRRDTIVQLLAQVACALHWFNPLVWFAAWRLDVERERSCDDLVLASGIRPSAYAGHLLEVVTGLSPARWTQSCGLAMARKSSLEGRLTAVLGKDLNRRDVSVALAGLALAIAVGVAVPIAMLRAADEKWNPPHGAHIGGYDFSALCVHDGKDASFVIVYHGDFDSTNRSSSNSKDRTWTDSCTITAKKPGIALTFHRTHTAPGKLSITTAPTEGRDLGKPAPPPREFGQKEYDLTKGRVFLLSDSGDVRQLDIATPVVADQASAKTLAALIAAIPPQEREDAAPTTNLTGKLAPETIAKLKWGEPVNGLRMALAYPPALGDALLGKKPHFELIVQNVSEKEVHFLASDEAPNPRRMLIREGERIVQGLRDHLEVSPADWKLLPGECGVLRLFATEESNKAGTVPSSAIESDLSKIGRYHAIVEMEIAKAPPGAWTGKLVSGPTRGSADVAAAPTPMHKDARALYEIWQQYARANGDIPGAMVGELAGGVRRFMRYNPTWKTVPTLNALLPRLDGTRDWKPADAIALLDEIAAIQDSPLSMVTGDEDDRVIVTGKPLPKELADKEWLWGWGKADASGLRIAWDLQPRDPRLQLSIEEGYLSTVRLGTALKGRLLVHNSGDKPVVLRVPTWYQGSVTAVDKDRKPIEIPGIRWTTLSSLVTHRLAPGDYVVILAPGIGFGKDAGHGPWAGPRVGWNVMAKPGDRVPLTHKPVPFDGSEVGRREDRPFEDGPNWWPGFIKARFARELPLPATAAERARMLERALRELFDSAPSDEERDGFGKVSDEKSLAAFAEKLAQRPGTVSFAGSLAPARAWFNIGEADPNADKQPRVVLGPGEYPLPTASAERGDATLKIVGRPVGDRRTNDAQLIFEATEFTGALPPDPYKLEVPDGWGTWAIVCRPGEGFFYLLHKGGAQKIDFTNPRKVTDTPATDLPAEFRDEVKRQLDIHEISDAQQAEMLEKPAAPAASLRADEQEKPKTAATELQPKTTEKEPFTAWGKEVGGLQIGVRLGEQRIYEVGETATLILRLRNNGKVQVPYRYGDEYFLKNPPLITDASGKAVTIKAMSVFGSVRLESVAPGTEVDLIQLKLDLRPATDRSKDAAWTIYGPGKFQIQYPVADVVGEVRPDLPAMKLTTGKLELEVKEPVKLPPAQEPFTAWGKEVGGLQAGLGFKAGEKRAYTHGETVTLVVRVRNVGKNDIKFQYYPKFLSENSPTVLDETGKRVSLRGNILEIEKRDIPKEVNLAVGKEIALYERELHLATGHEDEGELKTRDNSPTGKFLIQHEQVIGNSAQAFHKLDPALEKLATGKLELEIKPVAPVQQEAPKPKSSAMLKPETEQKLKWGEPVNGLRAALVMHPVPDEPDAEDNNDIFLAVQNVTPEAIRLHASDAVPNPRRLIWRDKEVLETVNETAKPIPADFQLQPREVAFFRMCSPPGSKNPGGRSTGSLIAESIKGDTDFSLEGTMEITKAPAGAWSGKLVSGRIEGGTAIPVVAPATTPAPKSAAAAPKPDSAYAKSGVPLGELGKQVEWSEAETKGLRLGIHIPNDAVWRTGEEVKAEVWVHNASETDVKFSHCSRADVGLSVIAKGADGKEHFADITQFLGYPVFTGLLLPAGNVVKLKEFTMKLGAKKDGERVNLDLPPGDYKLRVVWSDTTSGAAPEGEWKGKLTTRGLNVTVVAPDAPAPKPADDAALKPKHEYAQSLFRKWQVSARTDGKIPGALIGHVAREVDGYLKQYPADEKTPQLAALRPRLDASRDWTQAEVVALLDDITAISTAPVSWADIPMEFSSMRAVKGGQPLPVELESAAWGMPMENGLRAAWLLEPAPGLSWASTSKFHYALGTVLKARVLFHNTGKAPVVLKTETWHQYDDHIARDAEGAEIKVGGPRYSGITPMATFRLAPGEYCEVMGHGIAIGAGEYAEERSIGSVGAIIEAKEGDTVTLSHSVDAAQGGWTRPGDPKDPMELWKVTIAERIANEAPMPASAADRAQLIRRVTLDMLGVVPSAEEIAAFVADDAPDALARLTARLQAKQRVEPFSGKLPTGETKFVVIAADPDAAKTPRTGTAPGRYVLGDGVHLQVSQTTEGGKRTNKATILFLSPDPKVASPHKPHEIALPSGNGNYGIVWERGAGVLWTLEQKGLVREYDFTNPDAVKESRFESGGITNIPEHLRDSTLLVATAAGQESIPGVGEIVLHAIDVDTNKPIPDVTFVKENLLAEQWAISVGTSNHDGTLTFRSKPLPGYFFSVLPVPEGFKVAGLDEVPAGIRVGERIEHRFYLRKLGTNLQFLDELTEPPLTEQSLLIPSEFKGKDSIKLSVHDMPGFTGQEVKFTFHRSNAKLAERVFRNGKRVRAALADELKYFRKAEGVKTGDISEVSEVIIDIESKTKWALHCRTKNGMQLKQNGFRVHFDELDSWDLEVPAFLHPEF